MTAAAPRRASKARTDKPDTSGSHPILFGGNMKRSLIGILFLLMVMLFVSPVCAQTRVWIGPAGGYDFNNLSVGGNAGIAIPFGGHYELDLDDTLSPVESHMKLGHGYANSFSAQGFGWINDHWGLNGIVNPSSYRAGSVAKTSYYWFAGPAYRGVVGGFPARFTFNYIRQFRNGITPDGTESDHLQGFDLGVIVRYGCANHFCVLQSWDFDGGVVMTQGNPQCDGSFGGHVSCPRQSEMGGGFNTSLTFEFPRHRGDISDEF